MEDERWLIMAVLAHLETASKKEASNRDAIMEAIFALSNAYHLNMHNAATKQRYPLDGLSLVDVFKAGRAQLLLRNTPSSPGNEMTEDAKKADVSRSDRSVPDSSDAGFERFLTILREKTSFFKDIEKDSSEYQTRLKRAREKYDAKIESKKLKPADVKHREDTATAESKAKAEEYKAEGNVQLKAKNYTAAHELYTNAIEADANNAVYYSNRATAKLLMYRYSEAIDDCKKAIALDDKFVRPRERLASAYRHLGMAKEEVEALKEAIVVAPDNEKLKQQMSEAQERVNGGAGSGSGSGSAANGGGVESLLNGMPSDPNAINNMARSMGINLPDGVVESFMGSGGMNQIGDMLRQNPEMVQQAMRMMGGGAAAGGFAGMGGAPPNGAQGDQT